MHEQRGRGAAPSAAPLKRIPQLLVPDIKRERGGLGGYGLVDSMRTTYMHVYTHIPCAFGDSKHTACIHASVVTTRLRGPKYHSLCALGVFEVLAQVTRETGGIVARPERHHSLCVLGIKRGANV